MIIPQSPPSHTLLRLTTTKAKFCLVMPEGRICFAKNEVPSKYRAFVNSTEPGLAKVMETVGMLS